MIALQSQMDKALIEFKNQPLEAILSAQGNLLGAERLVISYEHQARNYLIAASVRGLAAQTRCALPAKQALAFERLQVLEADLAAWTNRRHQFYQTIEERLPELRDWFGNNQVKQEHLKIAAQTSQDRLNQAGEQVRALITRTSQTLKTQQTVENQPLSLLVELDDQGQVTKTWKLLKDETSEH